MIDFTLLKRQKDHFEMVATSYSQSRLSDSNYLRFRSLLWKFALKGLRPPREDAPLAVLEPMCGLCDGLDILCENNFDIACYDGFDYSQSMVDIARELAGLKVSKHHLRRGSLAISLADICTYQPPRKYDVVIVIGGLHHVYAHTNTALSRILSGLKSGGLFINFEPTHSNPVAAFIRNRIYVNNPFFEAQTESGYRLSDYNNKLKQFGLQMQKQICPGLLLYCLLYNPDAFLSLPPFPDKALRILFALESSLYGTRLARYLSFATLTVARRACQ